MWLLEVHHWSSQCPCGGIHPHLPFPLCLLCPLLPTRSMTYFPKGTSSSPGLGWAESHTWLLPRGWKFTRILKLNEISLLSLNFYLFFFSNDILKVCSLLMPVHVVQMGCSDGLLSLRLRVTKFLGWDKQGKKKKCFSKTGTNSRG